MAMANEALSSKARAAWSLLVIVGISVDVGLKVAEMYRHAPVSAEIAAIEQRQDEKQAAAERTCHDHHAQSQNGISHLGSLIEALDHRVEQLEEQTSTTSERVMQLRLDVGELRSKCGERCR